MYKGLAVSAVLVLLLSSVAGADAVNVQSILMGADNFVATTGGDGGAGNTNALTVAEDQVNEDPAHHVFTYQGGTGALVQSAAATGTGGLLGVTQTGDAVSMQVLTQPGNSLGIQDQYLNAWLNQQVLDGGGVGSALGIQSFVGLQTQISFTLWGASANIQGLGVTCFDAISGGPNGSMQIGGNTDVGIGQSQTP